MTRALSSGSRVVIVGGGFGGLECAKALGKHDVDLTLIDRTNHHLFQPLLYQVACAGLSPADIAVPIRAVLGKQRNTRVMLGEVTKVDRENKCVFVGEQSIAYDKLVLAVGAQTSYFGHDDWEKHAHGLKNLRDALAIREQMLLAFEHAESLDDDAARVPYLTFVVIGAGPTGAEMAGALSEIARYVLRRDYHRFDSAKARVVLVEAGDRVLSAFTPSLSDKAKEELQTIGVEVLTQKRVTHINEEGVTFEDGQHIASKTIVWAAGVRAHPLVGQLGAETDRAGRAKVSADFSLPNDRDVFVIGDAAALVDADGVNVPGLSPAAIQAGHFVADSIMRDMRAQPREKFRYFDKGIMATIGRSRAIAQTGKIQLSGFIAWLAWCFVHVLFLIGFRNRAVVLFEWAWQYFTWKRGARLIT